MVTDTNCNLASLDAYVPTPENPWNVSKINHLYRRIAFGATKNEVINALAQGNPSALVDSLIDQALALAPTTAPIWANWNRDDFEAAEMANENNDTNYYRQLGKDTMINDMIQNRVRDRLTLFWSNHFVTEDNVYRSPAYQFQYYNLLQLHALGNFRDFTRDIGICNAMLVYLNGDENVRDRPNENYARELYELFTLGVDNGYNEDDVQQTSKAITGYVDRNDIPWGDILFNPNQFNTETKSIFGQVGNWDYEDVIRILFEQRTELVARFICAKWYTYFVSANCNEGIVNQMAQTFIASNFEIAPVLRQLFKSEHFFDPEAIGSIIKSPCDVLVTFYHELDLNTSLTDPVDYLKGTTRMLGQDVLNPIDVEGWQGDEDWISPDYLIGRWESVWRILNEIRSAGAEQFRTFVRGLPIGTLADGDINNSYQGSDVTVVVKAILDYFLPRGLQNEILFIEAVGAFKSGGASPENYYDPDAMAPNIWTLDLPDVPDQIFALLMHIAELPEFQLK